MYSHRWDWELECFVVVNSDGEILSQHDNGRAAIRERNRLNHVADAAEVAALRAEVAALRAEVVDMSLALDEDEPVSLVGLDRPELWNDR